MDGPSLQPVAGRFWRMLRIRYQAAPLSGEGARHYGGRWNRPGRAALYLAADHATAVAEFHQNYVIPGTLVAYEVKAKAIADLTGGEGGAPSDEVEAAIAAQWLRIARIEGGTPPSWALADRLIEAGAKGALVPSLQNRGGTNLVLWRWSEDGARVRVLDPERELG